MDESFDTTTFEFEGWAILELMGHRKLSGFVRMNGPLIRIDVHNDEKSIATQWYGISSLYCLTPVTEEIAKRLTKANCPVPVTQWELELPREAQLTRRARLNGEFDDEDGAKE